MEGLTTSEVEERISKGLINEDVSSSTRTVKEIVKMYQPHPLTPLQRRGE